MIENEKRIRKQWLIMLILSGLITMAVTVLQQRFDPSLNTIPQARYWVTAVSLLSSLVFGFVSYHCIYKKPGTKLLIFCLILSLGSLVINPILYLSGRLNPPAYIPYYGAILLMTQGTGILWIVVCWRMLKVNKRLQAVSRSVRVNKKIVFQRSCLRKDTQVYIPI